MAYAALLHLKLLLEEELIQLPSRVLDVEVEHVKDFCAEVNRVLGVFKDCTFFPHSYLARCKEEFKRFRRCKEEFKRFRPRINEDSTGDARFGKVVPDILKIMPGTTMDDMLPKIPSVLKPGIMRQITSTVGVLDDINSRLVTFVNLPITYSITGQPSLSQKRCKEFANDLLFIVKEYKYVITFFNQVAEEAISICDKVACLLQKLENSTDHQVVNRIKIAAEEAGDNVENFLTGNPFLLEKTKDFNFKEGKIIFDLFNDIDQLLSHALEGISHSELHLDGDSEAESSHRPQFQHSTECLNNCQHGLPDSFPYIATNASSRDSSLKQEDILVGRDDNISKIIDELTSPPSGLTIVTIAGMGGVGKTTLAKKVFHHPNIVHHFHRIAWVNSIPSTDQMLSHLLHAIASSVERIYGQSREDKGEFLRKCLNGRKYLIAVDGLWNFDAWDAIQRFLPDDKLGSRILITSRFMEFPTLTNIPKNPPHCIRPLSKKHSWILLEKLVFGKASCPSELAVVGMRIAKKCGGLPLAIVVLAGILSRIPRSYYCWWNIIDSVNSIVSAHSEQCLDILALSYNYLPHNLKPLFLFMGAFPANCEIEVEKLINLWTAEGFLDSNSSDHSEKIARDYLEDLIGRSLVSVKKKSINGKIKTCLLHDLLRQLCLREAQKENFMHVYEADTNSHGFEKQRHLIFNLENCADLQILPAIPHLRSFMWLTFGSDFTPGLVQLQLSGFKWLRVLDMYFLPFDSFPEQLLKLVNLRYLALNVTYVLPALISRLWKLQTLMVYGPWISSDGMGNPTLFLEYWKMPWLWHVNVKVPSVLTYPHSLYDSQCRSSLQSLSTITFSSCTKHVFSIMPNLKKLRISETREDYENGKSIECFMSVPSLTRLDTLKCSFYKGNKLARNLPLDGLPTNLKKLTLSGSCLPWDKMKLLVWLPKLETLKLKNYALQGPEWGLTEEVFPRLKQLVIADTDLMHWGAESTDHFPCLERLVLRSCKSLVKVPCGVGELSVLQLIDLHYCSESAENSAREFEEQYGNPMVVVRREVT